MEKIFSYQYSISPLVLVLLWLPNLTFYGNPNPYMSCISVDLCKKKQRKKSTSREKDFKDTTREKDRRLYPIPAV
jgi:hypothetical protein